MLYHVTKVASTAGFKKRSVDSRRILDYFSVRLAAFAILSPPFLNFTFFEKTPRRPYIYYVYVKLGKRDKVLSTTILHLFTFFKEGASCVAPSVAKTQALCKSASFRFTLSKKSTKYKGFGAKREKLDHALLKP